MSSHVGPVVVGIFLQEEKAVPEVLGGPQALSREDPNFLLEQGNPMCIYYLSG
jgi:hypothetical protein